MAKDVRDAVALQMSRSERRRGAKVRLQRLGATTLQWFKDAGGSAAPHHGRRQRPSLWPSDGAGPRAARARAPPEQADARVDAPEVRGDPGEWTRAASRTDRHAHREPGRARRGQNHGADGRRARLGHRHGQAALRRRRRAVCVCVSCVCDALAGGRNRRRAIEQASRRRADLRGARTAAATPHRSTPPVQAISLAPTRAGARAPPWRRRAADAWDATGKTRRSTSRAPGRRASVDVSFRATAAAVDVARLLLDRVGDATAT